MAGECTKTYQQSDDKETKQFWSKIWELKEHKTKTEWINKVKKELQGLELDSKAEIHLDSLRATLKIRAKLENASP